MKPTQPRLLNLVRVSEERLRWVHGTLVGYPDLKVEISFEPVPAQYPCLPGTNISYFGMWGRGPRATLFEFQLGVVCVVPSSDVYDRHICPIIDALRAYNPPQVV